MKHRLERILQIKDDLAALPEVSIDQKELLSTQEAVTVLADVVSGLQTKGYTLDMIGSLLQDRGFKMSKSTLQRYLQRSGLPRAAAKKSASRTKAKRAPRPPVEKSASVDSLPRPAPLSKGGFDVRGDTEEL